MKPTHTLLAALLLAPLAALHAAEPLPWEANRPIVTVSKERYIARPRDGAAPFLNVSYIGPKLERQEVRGLLVASDKLVDLQRRISTDNGRTWKDVPGQPNTHQTIGKVRVREHYSSGVFDPVSGVLVGTMLRQLTVNGRSHNFTYTRLSWDQGVTWTNPLQLKYEDGEDFDPTDPLKPANLQRNHAYFGTSILRHSNGMLILPVAQANAASDPMNDERTWRMGSLCFIGKWNATARDYRWTGGSRVEIAPDVSSRGLMEPDAAELKDGRVLVVWRGSNTAKTPGRKWFALSKDGGRTLTAPQEWKYDDGSQFYSPSSFHRFLRHTGSGRLFWVGNICGTPPAGNRPRHPLVIAEVDEASGKLKRSTVTAIAVREPDQAPGVQFSNFALLEDRESHAIELYMTHIGGEAKNVFNADCWKYTLKLKAE
jgi:hypothetical protein